ncbi:hypothetical protein [Nocardia neocaledoniensis]|uniref:hypothetical protein n=1 Tax=Nocardia neocaledoniensis TaxID=236511 RepID=UPI0024557971|nr:hypothetical protein [Nocardia neocaledoniensis]
MTTLRHTMAEIAKLARVLDVDSTELDFLATQPASAIKTFRDQVSDELSGRDVARMQRIAAAVKLVPKSVAALVAEKALGPALAAAVAGAVDPARAVAIAESLSPKFLADATVLLDPKRAAEVIARVPDTMAAEVAKELIDRGDYLTMGRLAGAMPESVLWAALPQAADRDILQVGLHLEDSSQAERLLGMVTDRVPGMVATMYAEEKWADAISLLDIIGPAERARMADIVAEQDDEILDGLLTAVADLDAWDALLPVAADMAITGLRRLAQRPVMHDPATLARVSDISLTQNLWLDLLPLVPHLDESQQRHIAERVLSEDDDSLRTLILDSTPEAPTVIPLALSIPGPSRTRVLTLLDALPELDTLVDLLDAEHTAAWSTLTALSAELPDRTRKLLVVRAANCGLEDISEALTNEPSH